MSGGETSEDRLALPIELRDPCTEALGSGFSVVSRHDHDHGEARVWRLQDRFGEEFFLKCQRQAGKWHSETHAYEQWVPAAFGDAAPRIVAVFDCETLGFVTTALPGEAMHTLPLSAEQEVAAWEASGRALARLHNVAASDWFGSCRRDGSPQGEKPPVRDASAFVAESIESNAARVNAQGALSIDEREFIGVVAPEWTASLAGEKPVPVHRDYSPRNWISDPKTGAWRGVIDFEHSRWDVRAADMQRGCDREWLGRPDLKAAFFDGYQGGPPDDRLIAQARALRLLNAVGGVRWSVEHGDTPFETENRANLARLREEYKLRRPQS